MSRVPVWKRRFTAPVVHFPRWSAAFPNRLVLISNETGVHQAWSWDLGEGSRRQVSDERVGVEAAVPTPDGEGVVWFRDPRGDESGRWVMAPFEGGEARPLVSGVPDRWSMGLSMAAGVAVVGTAGPDGYTVHIAGDGEAARLVGRYAYPVGVGDEWELDRAGLSPDASLLCLRVAENGDVAHYGLRVIDPHGGEVVGELRDDGLGLRPVAWSPMADDRVLAVVHERAGFERPALWDPRTGDREDLDLGLPGDVRVADWWPDGSGLLLLQDFEARHRLFRLMLATRELEQIGPDGGVFSGAAVRSDGEVWIRAESAAHPPTIRTAGGTPVLTIPGPEAPVGRPFRPFSFPNRNGDRVHGFVVTPPGSGPHPVVMAVHGGPTWAYPDGFDPWIQAYVDHGFAAAMVNYRGSTGYGVAFRDALIGNIGFPEVEDIVAGLDTLVGEGIADPARAAIAGASWGGYITLLALGLHPDRWAAGSAFIPVGDYVACHEDCSPELQAWDVAVFGGTPTERPDLYRERSPITYVDRVAAPVLVVAGENDSRCPIRQVRNYVEALRARGGVVELEVYDAGHHMNATAERLRQAELELRFLLEHVPPG